MLPSVHLQSLCIMLFLSSSMGFKDWTEVGRLFFWVGFFFFFLSAQDYLLIPHPSWSEVWCCSGAGDSVWFLDLKKMNRWLTGSNQSNRIPLTNWTQVDGNPRTKKLSPTFIVVLRAWLSLICCLCTHTHTHTHTHPLCSLRVFLRVCCDTLIATKKKKFEINKNHISNRHWCSDNY